MNNENAIASLTQEIKNTLVGFIGSDEPGIITELVQIYQNDTQALMESLHEAVANHDMKTITSVTHTIKSSSGNLGANRLAELASSLEKLSKAGDITAVSAQLAQIEAEYKLVCLALKRLLVQ